ncbi:hypothetical protein ACWCPQ_14330 [Nocardia sp. NPDC001965]
MSKYAVEFVVDMPEVRAMSPDEWSDTFRALKRHALYQFTEHGILIDGSLTVELVENPTVDGEYLHNPNEGQVRFEAEVFPHAGAR